MNTSNPVRLRWGGFCSERFQQRRGQEGHNFEPHGDFAQGWLQSQSGFKFGPPFYEATSKAASIKFNLEGVNIQMAGGPVAPGPLRRGFHCRFRVRKSHLPDDGD
jgi:hypothetical protein